MKDFIRHVRSHLREYGFQLIFANAYQVNTGSGFRCSGYFSEDTQSIRIAKKSSNWLSVLVHEYAHFLDWTESTRKQRNLEDRSAEICEAYWKGNICLSQKVKTALGVIAKMEWQCDRRASRLILDWNLPINYTEYVKEANLYVYLHHLYLKYAIYGTRVNPATRATLAKMPSDFRRRSYKSIPEELEIALSRYF